MEQSLIRREPQCRAQPSPSQIRRSITQRRPPLKHRVLPGVQPAHRHLFGKSQPRRDSRPRSYKGIPVQEARATTVNSTLKVGQVSESVEVTATPLLNATDATNGYTLDSAQIDMTPLATGSFTQVAVLSPGVNAELLSNLDSNCRTRQSTHLGEWPARYVQHLPGEWSRLDQPVQWQEFLRRTTRSVTTSISAVRPLSADRSLSAHRCMAQTATACPLLRQSSRRSCA